MTAENRTSLSVETNVSPDQLAKETERRLKKTVDNLFATAQGRKLIGKDVVVGRTSIRVSIDENRDEGRQGIITIIDGDCPPWVIETKMITPGGRSQKPTEIKGPISFWQLEQRPGQRKETEILVMGDPLTLSVTDTPQLGVTRERKLTLSKDSGLSATREASVEVKNRDGIFDVNYRGREPILDFDGVTVSCHASGRVQGEDIDTDEALNKAVDLIAEEMRNAVSGVHNLVSEEFPVQEFLREVLGPIEVACEKGQQTLESASPPPRRKWTLFHR